MSEWVGEFVHMCSLYLRYLLHTHGFISNAFFVDGYSNNLDLCTLRCKLSALLCLFQVFLPCGVITIWRKGRTDKEKREFELFERNVVLRPRQDQNNDNDNDNGNNTRKHKHRDKARYKRQDHCKTRDKTKS